MIVDVDLIIENELQIDGYQFLEEVGNVINFSFKEIVTSCKHQLTNRWS